VRQQAVYFLHDRHISIKLALIGTLACAALGLMLCSLLNHYQTLQLFDQTIQWSLLGTGCGIGGSLLLGLAIYRCSAKLHIDKSVQSQFFARGPEWHSSFLIEGSGKYVRSKSHYHEWYMFKENGQNNFYMAKNGNVEGSWDHDEDGIPFLRLLNTQQDGFQITIEHPPQYINRGQPSYYPYYDEKLNRVFVVNPNSESRIESHSIAEEGEVFVHFFTPPGEIVSLIRYTDDHLILGYQSGLVQVVQNSTQKVVASYKEGRKICDAWLENQRLCVVTRPAANNWLLDFTAVRRVTVWQF
jgi:hypothetical protein